MAHRTPTRPKHRRARRDAGADAPSAPATHTAAEAVATGGWLLAKGPARVAAIASFLTGLGLLVLALDGQAFALDHALAFAFLAFLLAWRKSLTGWPRTSTRLGARWGFAFAALAALGAGTTLVLIGPHWAALPLGAWAVLLVLHARDARAALAPTAALPTDPATAPGARG